MPGTKGNKKTTHSADASIGLKNILAVMEQRERTELPPSEETCQPEKIKPEPVVGAVADELSSGDKSSVYHESFLAVGENTKKRYMSGKPPRVHKVLFEAIVEGLGGSSGGYLPLGPLLEQADTSRNNAYRILGCLEVYGYLRIRKDAPNKPMHFEVLKRLG